MYFFFYVFDGWSIVKMTGSMSLLSIFLHFFRLMVGLEVDGPLGVVLGGSKGLCGWSWAALRASVGGPGPSWGLCWRSWAVLGPLFGTMLAVLGCSWGLCSRSWASCWRSWAALGVNVRGLGPHVGGLGPLLGPMLAVLAALGASIGAPEPSWAKNSRRI